MFKKFIKKLDQIVRKRSFLIATLTLFGCFLLLFGYFAFFNKRVSPQVYVNGHLASFLDKEGVGKLIAEDILLDSKESLVVKVDGQEFAVSKANIELVFDVNQTAKEVLLAKKHSNILHTFFLSPFNFQSENIEVALSYNAEKLDELVAIVANSVNTPAKVPGVYYDNQELAVEYGLLGKEIDTQVLTSEILSAFAKVNNEIEVPMENVGYTITQEEGEILLNRANILINTTLVLSYDNKTIKIPKETLIGFLSYPDYNEDALVAYYEQVASVVNREPQNPVFEFADGRVLEFAPAKDGLVVAKDEFVEGIKEKLNGLADSENTELSWEIPVTIKSPDYETADVNDLGIRELLGVGTSTYHGSIASRIYNVGHASARFKGILVKPGEVFSFNDTLGDVSVLTGYKQAYIIKDGATVLGDGGGVCQVSTTLFRAAMDAGLPIVERRSHSYRVSYYEQDSPPGLDATVYAPTTDLKFKNDTPAHILIQAYADTQNVTLDFEIYGTSDGRTSTVSEPVVYSSTPPPEDQYTDDPTLPAGIVKQIDWKAWGAQVKFDYIVERDGEVLYQKTFYSNYQPWAAKFLRGVGPAAN